MNNLKKILFILTYKEKKNALILLIMMIITGLLEAIGVLSVAPFILVLLNPEIVDTNKILKISYDFTKFYGISSIDQYLIFLGTVFFLILIISISFKTLTFYWQRRYAVSCEFSVGARLFKSYLHQPYKWFLNRNSSEIIKNIFSEVSFLISYGIKPISEIFSQSIIVTMILASLIIFDPIISIFMIAFFVIFYGITYYMFTINFLGRIGKERVSLGTLIYTIVVEALGAVKELKVGRLENIYVEKYAKIAKVIKKNSSIEEMVGILPRSALEIFSFGGTILLIIYYLSVDKNFSTIIPIISMYVFAGYRLLPAIQKIYIASTQLRQLEPCLNVIHTDIKDLKFLEYNYVDKSLEPKKYISLNNIDFTYPNQIKKSLNNINLKIPINHIVGIVGATGSGKSTIVDVILSLLEPERGTLEIDDIIIDRFNKRSWQSSIGYVPQQIYLIDDTISANISLGKDSEYIKSENIIRAAKIANIHNFITQDLPLKYETVVGEKGIRLSGGQRQRIGIARALYNNPKVLILDEATNALDSYTENLILNEISNIRKNITAIIITHRLVTLMRCDKIFIIDDGKINGEGKFDELQKSNNLFQRLLNDLPNN